MTKQDLQFSALLLAIVTGATLLATDMHRHAIAAVWPFVVAFFEWQAI